MSSTGTWLSMTETRSLLKAECWNVLTSLSDSKRLSRTASETAKEFKGRTCLIIPYGPTQSADTLGKLIQSQTTLDVIIRRADHITKEGTSSGIGSHGPQLGRCRLAVVGMAGRFPDAASHEKLWDLLARGLDVHRVVPKDRFPVQTRLRSHWEGDQHQPYAIWLLEIRSLASLTLGFFNMSPREAFQTDPMQRMALTTAFEALEMSGYVPNRTPSTRLDRIGTFYGQTSRRIGERSMLPRRSTPTSSQVGSGHSGPGGSTTISVFSGPSLNIDTACSSSAAALQVACSSLWAKECDTAIVGGLSCIHQPGHFLRPEQGTVPFEDGPMRDL